MQNNINVSNIPEHMRQRDQWVMWRFEKRIDKSGKEKLTKVPYQLNGRRAKSNDPSTWSDFETCVQALENGDFDGLGYVFAEGDDLTGIDLDHCFAANGQLEPWAKEIVDRFTGTYMERSPSGDGVHIFCFGKPLMTGSKKWKKPGTETDQGIEVYNYMSSRYFTVTSEVFNG